MRTLPDDISFERWVEHVFDHPILDPRWYFHLDGEYAEEWNSEANSTRTLRYLTMLFVNPGSLISRFSRSKIDQGLNYVISSACSNQMSVLCNTGIPVRQRTHCITAMAQLYTKLMAPVYGDDLAHTPDFQPADRPNYACYMWWDEIPLRHRVDHPDIGALNAAVLAVFRETLKLRSEACLESVLHGCGHWHQCCPRDVEQIVDMFFELHPDASPALRQYAICAREGAVQ